MCAGAHPLTSVVPWTPTAFARCAAHGCSCGRPHRLRGNICIFEKVTLQAGGTLGRGSSNEAPPDWSWSLGVTFLCLLQFFACSASEGPGLFCSFELPVVSPVPLPHVFGRVSGLLWGVLCWCVRFTAPCLWVHHACSFKSRMLVSLGGGACPSSCCVCTLCAERVGSDLCCGLRAFVGSATRSRH